MLPAVNSVGKAYAARRGRRSGERGSTNLSLSAMSLFPADAPCQQTRPRRDSHSRAHHDFPFRSQDTLPPRAEFDQPDALSGRDGIARLLVKYDTARDQTRDLLEDDARALALDRHHILLVATRRRFFARHQEAFFPVLHVADGAPNGRAVPGSVEDIQENADAM